jgi:hypothetical protein
MRRPLVLVLILTASAFGGIVDDVRQSLAQSNFAGAESQLKSYQAAKGVTPEYLEALSWMGRAALSMQQYTQADNYARQTLTLAAPVLKKHPINSDEQMATAVGAALEVQALSLAGRGQKTQGIAVLRRALETYDGTSIARYKSQLASVRGTACACAARWGIPGHAGSVARGVERHACAAVLLGALVHGLQR